MPDGWIPGIVAPAEAAAEGLLPAIGLSVVVAAALALYIVSKVIAKRAAAAKT